MRLLIIEDEEDLANALAKGLSNQGYAVDVALDGQEGLELAEIYDYDLMILDLNLPGLDGIEICQQVREIRPQVFILMLTARSDFNARVVGLDLGADDYLVKPFHWGELMARIRALLRRDIRSRATLLRFRDLFLDPAARIARISDQVLNLTPKEFGILEYLMRRPGQVVCQQELLDHVWDMSADPFTNTIRVHMAALRRKLMAVGSGVPYIETVTCQGYKLASVVS